MKRANQEDVCMCKYLRIVNQIKDDLSERGLDPMKRAKQEDICMCMYLHIVNQIKDDLNLSEQQWASKTSIKWGR